MTWNLRAFGVVLAVVLALWLGPSTLGGRVLLPLDLLWQCPPIVPPAGVTGVHNVLGGDLLYENFAWKTFQRQCAAQGELALWNPYNFCGYPLYAGGQPSTFYPFNLIFLLLPLPYAYVVFTWLHLWLGGVFQYLFLRRIGVSGFGATLGGLVFAMCGFFAMRLVWPLLLGSAIWLPLMLLLVIALSESKSLRQAAPQIAGGAALFALPLLSGFFEIAFYTYVTAGLFALACAWHLWRAERSLRAPARLLVGMAGVAGFAAMLSGPQLLPFLEIKDRNVRAHRSDYQQIVARALRAEHLLPVVIPDFFGNPAKHRAWDLRTRCMVPIQALHRGDHYSFGTKNYSENGYYIGLLPWMLALFSLRVRGRHRVFFYVLLAVSAAFAFGTPLYAVLYHAIPGFEQVRTPFRWMFPATFAVVSLAAIGADHWRETLRTAPARVGRIIAAALVGVPGTLLAVLLALLAWPEPAHRLAQRALDSFPRLSQGYGFPDAWSLAGFMHANFLRLGLVALACVGVCAWRHLRPRRGRGVTVPALCCLAIAVVDVGSATYPFNTHSDPAWQGRTSPEIELLRADQGLFRIARFGSSMVLYPNLPLLFGLQDTGGYDSIILDDYTRYLEAIEPQHLLFYNLITGFNRVASLDSPLFSLLNVRYLVTTRELEHPDWEPVFAGRMRVYRNRQERPRAFLVHRAVPARSLDEAIEIIKAGRADPRVAAVVENPPIDLSNLSGTGPRSPANVRITHYGCSRVDLAVSSDAPGIVVLCDVMYPGWEAYVNDARSDILKVNGIFRGVAVPAGQRRVSFRFEPASLRRGWVMLGIGLAHLGGLIGMARLRPRAAGGPNVPGDLPIARPADTRSRGGGERR